jgi:hypothetical protein
MTMSLRIPRRRALHLGGLGLLAPLVHHARLHAEGVVSPRALFLFIPHGLGLDTAAVRNGAVDAIEARSPEYTGVFAPLNDLKAKVLLLEGATSKDERTGGGHHTNTILTGWAGPAPNAAPQSPSIDYFIDNLLRARYGTRTFGFLNSPAKMGLKLGLTKWFNPTGDDYSFNEGGQPLRRENNANALFARMVGLSTASMTAKPAEDPNDVARRTVYDYLLKDLQSFRQQGKLSGREAEKVEVQIAGLMGARSAAGQPVTQGQVGSATLPWAVGDRSYVTCNDWDALQKDEAIKRKCLENHLAIVRLGLLNGFAHTASSNMGMVCGKIDNGTTTRLVVSETLDHIRRNGARAKAEGVVDDHNMVAHYDLREGADGYSSWDAWGGSRELARKAHREIQRRAMEYVAGVAKALDAVKEANGMTALDNTLMFVFSDMSDGNHQIEGMKYVLIGGKAIGLRQGAHLKYPSKTVREQDVLREVVNLFIRATGGSPADLKKTWGNPGKNNPSFDLRLRA